MTVQSKSLPNPGPQQICTSSYSESGTIRGWARPLTASPTSSWANLIPHCSRSQAVTKPPPSPNHLCPENKSLSRVVHNRGPSLCDGPLFLPPKLVKAGQRCSCTTRLGVIPKRP